MASINDFESFVAIDIGSFSLKFAYVQKNDDGNLLLKTVSQLTIPQYECELSPEQRETMSKDEIKEHCLKELRQFLTTHVTEMLYDNEIQTKRAITFASNREVTIRCIEITPVFDQEKLTEAITSEANKQMPFSMGNAVLGYHVQGDTIREEKALTQIMVAALQKEIVEYVTLNFKGAGLSNEGILTLPQTLQMALNRQMAPYTEGDKKVAIIHCGHSTTSIMIYKNGKIQFFRDVSMAGSTITDAIYAGGELDGQEIKFRHINEATELKHKLGVMPPDEIGNLKGVEKFAAQKIFETVEKIFQHIQLSISFYISQTSETGLDKIFLTGGSAGMNNFKEFIEESLEVPTVLGNPFPSLKIGEIKYSEQQRELEAPALSPLLGAAAYQGEKEIINFIDILFPNRKAQNINLSGVSSKFGGSFTEKLFKLDEQKLRIIAGLLAALLLLLGAYPVVKIRQKISAIKSDYKMLQKKLEQLNVSQASVKSLLEDQKILEKYGSFASEIKKLHFNNSAMLLEIASLTPDAIFLTAAEFSTDTPNATFKLLGHADSSDSVFEYLGILGRSSILQNPTLESTQEVPIDEDRYFIRFVLNGRINSEALRRHSDVAEETKPEPEDDFEPIID